MRESQRRRYADVGLVDKVVQLDNDWRAGEWPCSGWDAVARNNRALRRRRSLAHPLDLNGVPNPCVKLHCLHPSAPDPTTKGLYLPYY